MTFFSEMTSSVAGVLPTSFSPRVLWHYRQSNNGEATRRMDQFCLIKANTLLQQADYLRAQKIIAAWQRRCRQSYLLANGETTPNYYAILGFYIAREKISTDLLDKNYKLYLQNPQAVNTLRTYLAQATLAADRQIITKLLKQAEAFLALAQQAYAVLGDPEQRRRYDEKIDRAAECPSIDE